MSNPKHFEEFLDNEATIDQLKSRLAHYVEQLNQKASHLSENKKSIHQTKNSLQNQINKHYEFIVNHLIAENKRQIEQELERDFRNLDERINSAMAQVERVRTNIENEYVEYQGILQTHHATNSNTYDADFNEEDTLMINDSVYDFENESGSNNGNRIPSVEKNRQAVLVKVESVLRKMESLMCEKLLINNFFNEEGFVNSELIRLVKCTPDLSGFCFGHLKRESNNNSAPLFSPVDQLDHTKFEIDLADNHSATFRKGDKAFITFFCPDTKTSNPLDDQESLHDLLQVDMYDSQDLAVAFDLKEKMRAMKRFIRICFVPQSPGVHKLSIKFKHTNIPNSPFYFTVLPSAAEMPPPVPAQNTPKPKSVSIKAEPVELAVTGQILPAPKVLNAQRSVADKLESSLNEGSQPKSISAGRGKLIKLSDKLKNSTAANQSSLSTQIAASISQKRKSYQDNDSASNGSNVILMEAEERCESPVRELSNKLKRVVRMDGTESAQRAQKMSNGSSRTQSIISDHIRKYSSSASNRLLEDKPIPPLKAQFQRKFLNCFYPIGVRVCKLRNWLIVCDCGNNAVKVFERTTGELLNEIRSDASGGAFTLVRPSAVLINHENNAEIYVKDDKEILVFDLEQECKFIRKFGFKILRRPYGLAYDSHGNLVLVDADMKNPLIYTFDKASGKVINSKPYQPVLSKHGQSAHLQAMFGQNKTLGNELAPFEKTKVRFICCNQDNLYASDLGRSIIFKTTLSGETQMAFGKYGKKRGELNEPSGIHVDNDGKAILVGDSKNDRIQIYDEEGRYKCDIDFLEEKIVRPSDIHVDSDGYIYVSCFIQHCVKKFKLVAE